ncbi:MAG TPA: hypothetical protein VFA51_01075 [Candidatus Udaeobacter sp.]|nr:hypothetical protein [Candidatus Udaeobacter sp.]
MKIYFENPEFDGQFLRAVEYAPIGAQIGEAWVIAAQIQADDTTGWYKAWSGYADRLYDLAVQCGAGEHCETGARQVFFKRCLTGSIRSLIDDKPSFTENRRNPRRFFSRRER